MLEFIKKIFLFIDDYLFRYIVKIRYPQYKRPRYGYSLNIVVLIRYAIPQLFSINAFVPWPVDSRSVVLGWKNIQKGNICDPGDNPGIYINAKGGLSIGDNVEIAANTTITTTNHHPLDIRKTTKKKGIKIGSNVWIGANCSIIAGVTIGDNVVIGAGCIIREDVPSNTIVKTSENILEYIPKKGSYRWNISKEVLI